MMEEMIKDLQIIRQRLEQCSSFTYNMTAHEECVTAVNSLLHFLPKHDLPQKEIDAFMKRIQKHAQVKADYIYESDKPVSLWKRLLNKIG